MYSSKRAPYNKMTSAGKESNLNLEDESEEEEDPSVVDEDEEVSTLPASWPA